MYIDHNTIQGEMIDKYYIFKEELKTLCCSKVFKLAEVVKVYRYTSKNRVMVETQTGSCHKVKRSSLNRVTEEYDGNFNKK